MAPPKHLNFITGNKNKLLESQAILGGIVELRNQPLDLVEIQGTIEEVITDKCRRAADAVRFNLHTFSAMRLTNVFLGQRPCAC